MSLIDLKDIASMLADRIEDLCADVLPRGRRHGKNWVDANVAAGGLGDSMMVCLQGPNRGVFNHFGAGRAGDAIDLIAYVLYNGDKKKAVAYAKSFLGLDNARPHDVERVRSRARKAAQDRAKKHQDQIARRKRQAHAMWLNARPLKKHDPVLRYLQGTRGIPMDRLAKLPGALRFTPDLYHVSGRSCPAMVAAVHNAAGEFVAVHRTYLSFIQGGAVRKAALGEQAKMVLGPYGGGTIALSRGVSGKSLKDAPEGDEIILCEGIEDGLSLAVACPDWRVHAAVSVGNFQNVVLPPAIRTVLIAADNDAPGTPAARAMQKAVDRFIDQGREVYVARPEGGKDFNDMLMNDGGGLVVRGAVR